MIHNTAKHRILIGSILLLGFVLRVISLASFPPSLYWEEVALGYDAYSILQTGKDHHGHWFPIVAFESFGDWKPSLYFYSIVPFILLFGLSATAVRLPSVIAGTITIYLVGKIAGLLFPARKASKHSQAILDIQYLAMLCTAISPWAIQFSRAGWEVNLATTLITAGMFFGISSWQQIGSIKLKLFRSHLLWSAICLILSMFTYHATRIVAPVLGIFIIIPWLKHLFFHKIETADALRKSLTLFAFVAVIAVILCTPLLFSLGQKNTTQRFSETSIFTDLEPIELSNQLIAEDGNTVIARIIHHRYVIFSQIILRNYLGHFSPTFLFVTGDQNPRHSIQMIGQLYYLDAIFLILGVLSFITLVKKKPKVLILLVWLAISLLPASITKASPHALRILPALPVYMFMIALGIQQLLRWSPTPRWCYTVSSIIAVIYIVSFLQFWHFYSKIYPVVYASEWQYGYEQLISTMTKERGTGESVYITREQGRPAMYYWFFTQTDPTRVQAEEPTARKDQGEFLQFENVHFVDGLSGKENGLIASSPEKFEQLSNTQKISEITDQRGKVIWVIYRVEQ